MLGEDSEAGEDAKGQYSTRRLIALPWLQVLQAAQLIFQFRIVGEHAAGDFGDLLCFFPAALELRDFGPFVHGHFEGEAPLRREAAERELAPGDIADQFIGSPGALHEPRRVLSALVITAGEGQVRESLAERGLRIGADEQRAFGATVRAAQEQGDVGPRLVDHARVRDVPGAEIEDAAAALADRRLDQTDPPAPHHAAVHRPRHVRHVPHEHTDGAAGGDVHRDGEPHGRYGHRHDELQLLAPARPQPLAVAPRGELHAWWLPDANQVVSLPADQGDLLARGGHATGVRGARHRLDPLEPVVERGEVPARAARADHPQPAPPLVEGEALADAEPRGPAVAVELAVAERAGAVHKVRERGAGSCTSRCAGGYRSPLPAPPPYPNLSTRSGAISMSVLPVVNRSAMISPVSAARRIPLRP